MKKVLFISNICKKIDNFTYSSMIAAKELGYEFHVATNWNDIITKEINDYEKINNVFFHRIEFVRNPIHPANYKAYKQLMVLIKNEKFDIVHCNTPVGGLLGRICSNKIGIRKVIYMVHGFHFYKDAPFINKTLFKWAEMWMAHYTDAIITINHEDFQSAKILKLRNNGKTYYVPGVGVETSAFKNATPKKKEILKEIGADTNSVLLISIGELNKNKNNRVIIKALDKLKNHDIHYILCGVGKKEDELLSIAKKSNLEKNVHFLGYRTDVSQLLKSCDVFVIPSYREGLSRSMIEAMAAGLPCIASKIRGNVDLIEDGKGGYLCDIDDVDGFAKAISEVVKDKKGRSKMGEINLQTINKYDVENVNIIIKDIYSEVFSSHI